MFEKIKENWQERIERNAVVSQLTHANKKGIKLMKEGTSLENLPSDCKVTEEVIFKRTLLPLGDWSRIYPPVNDKGRLNLANLIFGGWRNLVWLILTLGIIAMVIMQFYNDFTVIETLRNANEILNATIEPDLIKGLV